MCGIHHCGAMLHIAVSLRIKQLPRVPVEHMQVEIISAKTLMAADKKGTSSDPFVTFSLGGKTQKTKAVPGSLNPVWNAKFRVQAQQINRPQPTPSEDMTAADHGFCLDELVSTGHVC